ncbi:helix-turn-helix domain-containing protein [Alkalicoccus saliphilus]|uniref:Transcriptional regulator n=1 Tax=Alkalicoccus saliphilus TaxID=200989 RepID=A0A2T4U2N3_9BACI|nr:helix-turn-helix transcriptional regulator [Alkalicoccus saliphilus]PTL37653.1 transcriptional regulator [Alkalicoccus saliphilus]
MNIGDNIKAIRTEKKLTQQELADNMNISRSYLSDVENNRKNPSMKTIESLASKLNVSIAYLTSGRRMLSDMSREEISKSLREASSKSTKALKERLREDIDSINIDDLDIIESTYLINTVFFLKFSKEEDVSFLASMLRVLNHLIEGGLPDNSLTEEESKELNTHLEDTIQDFEKYLKERFLP